MVATAEYSPHAQHVQEGLKTCHERLGTTKDILPQKLQKLINDLVGDWKSKGGKKRQPAEKNGDEEKEDKPANKRSRASKEAQGDKGDKDEKNEKPKKAKKAKKWEGHLVALQLALWISSEPCTQLQGVFGFAMGWQILAWQSITRAGPVNLVDAFWLDF